jgi:hypothetical protein
MNSPATVHTFPSCARSNRRKNGKCGMLDPPSAPVLGSCGHLFLNIEQSAPLK